MVAYGRTHDRKEQSGQRYTDITFKIDVAELAEKLDLQTIATPKGTPMPKHICGYIIKDAEVSLMLQAFIVAGYMLLVLFLIGFFSFPRFLITLVLVAPGPWLASWCDQYRGGETANLLVIPAVVVLGFVRDLLRGLIKGMVRIVVDGAREVMDEMEVDVESTTT